MKTVNSLSGGKTSSYMAAHYPADYNVFAVVCIDDPSCRVKDPSLLKYSREKLEKFNNRYGVFSGTAESDQTLAAMRDLEQLLGRSIDWVRSHSFEEVIDGGSTSRLPSWARRYCTTKMKINPIFEWWFQNFSEKVEMRIGFRFDEFRRTENLINRSNLFKYHVAQKFSYSEFSGYKLTEQGRKKNQDFDWRKITLPLVRDGVTRKKVNDWKPVINATLFNEEKEIFFPHISNCVGCFHKNLETIAALSKLDDSNKIRWFAKQEEKGKGTWRDDKITYKNIIDNAKGLYKERLFEIKTGNFSCDSEGCTD